MEKLRIGICGYGGLGRLHVGNLIKMDDVEIVAVCDVNPRKLEPGEIKTNLQNAELVFDIRRCRTYTDLRQMLKKERLDAVVSALPTYLHAKCAILVMNAGVHIFSEKPMALTVKECDRMIQAKDANKVQLQIGQCLRFWPEYETLKAAIDSKPYGKLHALSMTRIGGYCTWADPDWFNDGKLSGGAILDLHMHDADWALHALGVPQAICAAGTRGKSGAVDDVTALWQYDDCIVTMKGSWMYQAFNMSFQAFFENASMDYGIGADPDLRVTVKGSAPAKVDLPASDGAYFRELRYFFDCIRGTTTNTVCTAESTRKSIELVMLENKAIAKRKWLRCSL